MTQTAFALSDTGKVRTHNEDSFCLLTERGIFLVSDGMGGQNAGAVASQLVVDRLPQMIAERVDPISARRTKTITLALRDTIVDLSRQVRGHGESQPELNGMGATLVL